jgi:hypothetical protein
VCTVSGSGVSLVGAGTCVVNANQPGNGSYLAAPQVQQSFVISPPPASPQTITFTSTAPSGAVVGGTYAASATASSGLPVSFSAAPSSAGVCTVSGSTVSFVGAGTCTVDANQAGNASYQPAPQAQQAFSISTPPPGSQTITFTSSAPSGAHVGDTYAVSATASSGLPVSFSAAGSSAGICTVSGSTVTLVGAGTCTVNANQAGNGSYAPAPQVQQAFSVTRIAQTISFTSSAPSGAVVGGPTYTVAATASSGLTVTFTAAASSAGICTVSGSTVSFVGAGTCTVHADQAGNATYQPAPQAQQSFSVASGGQSAQTITFTSSPPAVPQEGESYNVSAVASSGLTVTFSVSGSCSLSGGSTVLFWHGTCTVHANQAGNASYLPAPEKTQVIQVNN